MATLRNIADSLGVSVSLVSKVLNGNLATTRVSARTAGEVRQAAERLGYRRNMSALALLANRHRVLGICLRHIGVRGSGIMEEMLDGISCEATALRYSLRLGFFGSVAQFEELTRDAHSGTMDGLLVGGHFDAGLRDPLLAIRRAGLPVATIFDVPLAPELPNTGMRQEEVAGLATRHLIAGGARRIAHVFNMAPRLHGYRQALAAAGLDHDADLVYYAKAEGFSFDHRTGENAVRAFFQRRVAFDGIVTQSDHEAMGCLNVLCDAGVRVPEQVQIIGIDNAPFCEMARVPLSSVSMAFRHRGALAVRMLAAMVDGKTVRSTRASPVLMARASTRVACAGVRRVT